MRNDLNVYTDINEQESLESQQDKETIWKTVFGEEYKPDFDFSFFFTKIEKYINKHYSSRSSLEKLKDILISILSFPFNDKSLNFLKNESEEYSDVINLVKDNNYKLDINFLESLDNNKKHLISRIFIDSTRFDNLSNEFIMGESLFIWMSYWYNYKKNNLINHKGFEQLISKHKFIHFYSFMFIQAYHFIWSETKLHNSNDFFYDVLVEYNLIKNIDEDAAEINKNKLNIGENFSLGTFHTRSELGFGKEKKYGSHGLDKKGNETNIHREGDIIMLNEKGEEVLGAFALDRNHKSINTNASGIEYQVYIDSPSGIALLYNDKPVACICFYIRNGNEFFINQIQKIAHYEYDRYGRCIGKHYSNVVKDIDWKNTLYNVVKKLTDKYNIKKIVIQGGKNNRWIHEFWKDLETPYFKYYCKNIRIIPANKGKIHLPLDIAKEIYDVFAEGLGFNQDKDGNREKEI